MKQSLLDKDQFCLETINEAIDKILEYTSVYSSADEFNDAYRDFDATMMNFVVIGEMVEKISDDFKRKHSKIDWIKIKGFRNIVAHDYFGIDAEEVWQIIKGKIPVLKSDLQELLS